MEIYLDSADMGAVAPLLETGLFAGVTTNPLILERAGVKLADLPRLTSDLLEAGAEEVFLQVTDVDSVDSMVEQGRKLRDLSDRVIVKIPATRMGLTATSVLNDDGIPVLVTAVYHARQALLARCVGAQGIAPYLGRMTEAGRDGRGHLAQMQKILEGSGTHILVASIRSVDDVHELAVQGIDAVTLSTSIAAALFDEPLTDLAVTQFTEAVNRLS